MMRTHRSDERALRRTRLRLALWSGAITLVVLVLLGGTLYLVVARQLAADSEQQLRARAEAMALDPWLNGLETLSASGVVTFAGSAEMPGLVLGGPLSGTVANVIDLAALDASGGNIEDVAVALDGLPPTLLGLVEIPVGLVDGLDDGPPDTAEELLVATELEGTPVRVLTTLVEADQNTAMVRVMSDRSAEVGTLETLFLILFVAVPLVAVAAVLAGWLYSGRALVPIRIAIERQRRFAADASHELRTPLTVLSGNLQALAASDGPISREDEAITDSVAEAERMAVLLDDLLLLARTDAGALHIDAVAMDLADEVTEGTASLAPRAAERGIDVVLDMAPSPMHGDPTRLRQLGVLLVDNAIRHGSADGHAWVTVRPDAESVTLVVADDGPGIDAAERERVFERFHRGRDANAPGHGLGLSIARWIVAAHGGEIVLDGRPGGGARFTVSLPDSG